MKLSEFKVKDRAWYLDKTLSMVECFAFYVYPDDLNDVPDADAAAAADAADADADTDADDGDDPPDKSSRGLIALPRGHTSTAVAMHLQSFEKTLAKCRW